MRFAIFKGEKSISDLTTRLFRIQGRGSKAATKQAADTLLKANPQLKDISKVAVGSIIAIPDTAPPVASEEGAISAGLMRVLVVQNRQAAFDAMQQRLSDIETSALDQLKSGMDRFQTAEMKTAMKTVAEANFAFPGEVPSLDTIAKGTKEILKNIQAAQAGSKKAFVQLRATLASFAK